MTAVFLTASIAPASVSAQSPPATPSSLEIDAGFQATSIRGALAWMAGGAVLFRLPNRLSVGTSVWTLLGDRPLDPSAPAGGLRLDVAYGGAVAAFPLTDGNGVALDVRLLVGAGTARVKVPVELAQVAADNFFVVEPAFGLTVPLDERWHGRLSASYRAAIGVEDLFGLTSGQVSGGSIRAAIVFRGFGRHE